MRRAIAGKPNLHLHLMESYYPSGDEKNVIFEITGQVVPTGKLPIDLAMRGDQRRHSALNIADAVDGVPVTEKAVTIAGDVPEAVTVTVPIGVSMRDVLRLSGFAGDERDYALLVGGPCMGNLWRKTGTNPSPRPPAG